MGVAPLSMIPKEPLAKRLLSVTLGSAGLKFFEPVRGITVPRNTTMDPLNECLRICSQKYYSKVKDYEFSNEY